MKGARERAISTSETPSPSVTSIASGPETAISILRRILTTSTGLDPPRRKLTQISDDHGGRRLVRGRANSATLVSSQNARVAGEHADLCSGAAGGLRERHVVGAATQGEPRGAQKPEPEPAADLEPGAQAGVVRRRACHLRRFPAAGRCAG